MSKNPPHPAGMARHAAPWGGAPLAARSAVALRGVQGGALKGVLMASASLPGTPPRDPADRIIAAVARAYGHLIITRRTRRTRLTGYAECRHSDVLAC